MPDFELPSMRTCRDVTVYLRGARIHARLSIPENPQALVMFAHATGRGRANPRNRMLSDMLNDAGIATMLCDLLTSEEEVIAELSGDYRQDYAMQSIRLMALTDWSLAQPELQKLPIGYFAAGTAAASALCAANARPELVKAMVMRSGRPDLAWEDLKECRTPTLMIAGERDTPIRAMNWVALQQLAAEHKDIFVLPGAGHLFVEQGALEAVGEHAKTWFLEHLGIGDRLVQREMAGV